MDPRKPNRNRRTLVGMSVIAMLTVLLLPSVAFGAHSFDDVPDTHIFHDEIAWMADNAITSGCTPTDYCPKDGVTRAQMARFMKQLAESQAVDAGTLGGKTAAEIAPMLWSDSDSTGGGNSVTGINEVNSIDLTAPGDGYLVVSGQVYINPYDTTFFYQLDPLLDGVSMTPSGWAASYYIFTAGADGDMMTYTITVPVTAGDHTVSQNINGGGSTYFYNAENLTVVFYPTGTYTTSAAVAGSDADSGGEG